MAETQTKTTDIIAKIEKFYKQIPNLPENIHEVLVKIAPWFSLIFGILGLYGGIKLLGWSPWALIVGFGIVSYLFVGACVIVASVLLLMAYPKLVKRQYKGWEFLFWAEGVSLVSAVINLSLISILFVLFGFYLLFQIKSYYK